MKVDYLVVGSGLTGATIARLLSDAGCQVLIVDRRSHIGGNVHDHFHPSGIRIHTYGPHYFRTSSDRIWSFVNRFSSFYKYEAALQTLVDGKYEAWPVNKSYMQRTVGPDWKPEFTSVATNFEEASLAMMPRATYEKFVKGYTEKQWGVSANSLGRELAGRFSVHEDNEPRLKQHRYQGIPTHGYAEFTKNIISGIPVILNYDYLKSRNLISARKALIFTGPIDEFFDFQLGKLAYRGQRRTHRYFPETDLLLPCGQINNPDPKLGAHVRELEWKHMMSPEYANQIKGTVLTREEPFSPSDPSDYEYPFPDSKNQELAREYQKLAEKMPNLLICGRLGDYRYYDMDQAIARAMMLTERVLLNNAVEKSASLLNTASRLLDEVTMSVDASHKNHAVVTNQSK